MKKRLLAIVLTLALVFALFPTATFAAGGDIKVSVTATKFSTVQFNGKDTMKLDFMLKTENGEKITGIQVAMLAIDLSKYAIIGMYEGTPYDYSSKIFPNDGTVGQDAAVTYSSYKEGTPPSMKTITGTAEGKEISGVGYLVLTANAAANQFEFKESTSLMSVLLGLKEDVNWDSITSESLRLATNTEAKAFGATGVVVVKSTSTNEYVYGKDGAADTLTTTPTLTTSGFSFASSHTHVWDTAWKTNATHHWHNCTAEGCTLTDADNALKGDYGVHEYNQTVATPEYKATDATHTKKATYYKSCICGKKGTETFESGETVPHEFNRTNTDRKYLKSDATCQAKAVYFYSCECGEIGTETFEYGEKAAHSYETGWTSDGTNHYHRCLTEGCTAKDGQEACSGGNPATCQAKSVCATCKQPYGNLGAHTYTTDYKLENADSSKHYHVCTICNLKDTGEAHIADRSEATETDPVKCTKCDYVMTPALGHICKNHLTKHEAKNADCTNNGNREYYECTCGKYYSDANAENEITDHSSVIIPAGHKFTAVIAEVPATCTKTGTLAHRDCTVCEKHFATDSATELKNLVIPANGHKTTLVAKVDSTCTAVGTKEHYKCTVCEKLFQDAAGTVEATEAYLTIAKKAHTLIPTPAKAPTCVAGGNDAYWTCSVCGNVYSDEAGTIKTSVAEMTKGADAKAHDLEKVPAVASTCKVQGHGEYYKCKLCGKMFDKNTDDKQELTTITLLPLAAHDYGTYYSDANSHWQFCKVCGDKKSAAHTPGADATDTTSQVCQDCRAVLKKATGTTECGHKEQAHDFNANGTQHWHYCANCGERIGDAENHNFGTEKVVKEATKTETGLKTKTCATCGWVQPTVILATGGTTTPGGNGGTGGGFPFKDSNKTNNTGKVESQKTFDGGIALYVGLSVLSLTGSALVIRKKKEF